MTNAPQNLNKQAYRADGGDIGTDRIKEIANNPYGDEEKCWLAKKMLALQVKLDSVGRTLSVNNEAVCSLVDESEELKRKLDAATKRNAELIEFVQHVHKCLLQNGEYAPLSHELIQTVLGIRADGKGAAQ